MLLKLRTHAGLGLVPENAPQKWITLLLIRFNRASFAESWPSRKADQTAGSRSRSFGTVRL